MDIEFTKLTESLSIALDYAEKALINVEPMHGMRIAVMTDRMARYMGFDRERLYSLTQAAMLHDCALSEYLRDEMTGEMTERGEMDMAAHCVVGENILKKLPFYDKVEGSVLYHHERADGNGALGLKAPQTPLTAQLIHMADAADVNFGLYSCDDAKYASMCEWVRKNTGTSFTKECAEAFVKSVDYETLQSISGSNCRDAFRKTLPDRMIDVSTKVLRDISMVFAEITDYKSHFTWRHSMGIAEKAEAMGRYYGCSDEECGKLFVAGALHDIGKLITNNAILHKEGKLTSDEYAEIQNHALGTWELLHDIKGLEDITNWAAFHHEKLDGTGYPFGLTGEKMDRNSRLMACLDIYQALVEDRPYKSGMKHEDAMNILWKLGNSGKLDTVIIKDIDSRFRKNDIII